MRAVVCAVAAVHVCAGISAGGETWHDQSAGGWRYPDRLPGGTGINLVISGGWPLGMPEFRSGSIEYARHTDTVGWAAAWEMLGADGCQEHTLRVGAGVRIGRFRAGATCTAASWWFAGGVAADADVAAAVAVDATRTLELRIAGSGIGGRLDTPAASLGARYRAGMWDVGVFCDVDNDGVCWNLLQRVRIPIGAAHVHAGYTVTSGNGRRPPEIVADVLLRRGRYFAGYAARWNPWFPVEHRVSAGVATGGTVPEVEASKPARARAPVRSSAAYTGPPVDLNTATAAELERLPGIGRVLAQRIIAYRKQVGVIRSLDELRSIGRISSARIAAIAPFVTVATAAQAGARTSAPDSGDTISAPEPQPVRETSSPETYGRDDFRTAPAVDVCADTAPVAAGELFVRDGGPAAAHMESPGVPEADLLTRINTMAESDFIAAGFSPFDARNIVRYRGRHGRFRAVRQLYDVPNIDRRMVAAFLAESNSVETGSETP